jgi:hypothetical protein
MTIAMTTGVSILMVVIFGLTAAGLAVGVLIGWLAAKAGARAEALLHLANARGGGLSPRPRPAPRRPHPQPRLLARRRPRRNHARALGEDARGDGARGAGVMGVVWVSSFLSSLTSVRSGPR